MRSESLFAAGSLWLLIAVPSVWAAHFLLCYWATAVWCAKFVGAGGPLATMQVVVGVLTAAALLTLLGLAVHASRRYGGRLGPDDDLVANSEPERSRFLGHTALLLCTLSAVAVIFDAVPVLVIATCG